METKNDKTPAKKWEKYAGAKKPSMKRRMEGHDYFDRGIYMITMAIEGRKPLLGTLHGEPTVTEGDRIPQVTLSAMGEKVKECWMLIPSFHPKVKILKLCIMPDHIHGILFVQEKMEKPLGKVIEGFKIGTRKAARELGIMQTLYPALSEQEKKSRHTAAGRTHGKLWEPNYNDRILMHKGQLKRMFAYLEDNPRRLLLKRQHPEYFTRLGTINVAGIQMQAVGNRFLLDNPVKLQIQCSRRLTLEEIEHQKDIMLYQAHDQGAILVSPCISPGEQQIATAALTERIPLIVLLLKGFSPFFKPQPKYLEACTEGRLLMLSPYPYQNEKIDNMRQRCIQLNNIAVTICS